MLYCIFYTKIKKNYETHKCIAITKICKINLITPVIKKGRIFFKASK